MRTSGADTDILLYMVPVVVLTVLAVSFLGGPSQAVALLDAAVIDALHRMRSLW